ncbi:transporter [Priestia filamentosa]|uniref:transporter n=1 Tax=Priestia filamentosa TaxID=1402861 RepID=UPI0039826907
MLYPYYYRQNPWSIFGGPSQGNPGTMSQGTTPPPPSSAPPTTIPPKPGEGLPPGTYGYVPPISVNHCLFKIAYIWPKGGSRGFWFYPYYVDQNGVAGYIWNGSYWQPTGLDLEMIDLITC